ncbi:hypothetical protein B0T18DRAFT_429357 [Schizothecium vesticola]|uniref:Uncharacterized protein n=1 Tax=Schizothecium vesticola TaxID=314040 RepID=A0AA40K574_9PEZI|nr:hypothetical protein B0T18DRAFT_429357 [Schizothecium vesticola]
MAITAVSKGINLEQGLVQKALFMYNPDKSSPGGDPVTDTTTTKQTVAEASLMAPSFTTTARAGEELASDEGEISIAFSSPVPQPLPFPHPDPFQFETPTSAALPEMATPDSVRWGDARREVHLGAVGHPATSSGPATPSSAARQPTRAGSSNPFRAGPANKTPGNEDGDWETIFGDGNTGTNHQKRDYGMRRQYDNGDSDDDDYPRQWGVRCAPTEARPLSPLFPGVPVDTRFPLFGTGTMKSPALPNRRLVFGEERPVFPPEQRVHRVNGHLLDEEDESGNATTTTVTTTTKTTTTVTPSQSARSRQGNIPGQYYEGDDDFSTEFEDIPLGACNETTTSSRHLRVELNRPVPRPLQLKATLPLPLHLDQLENQPSQQESRGWFGRAYNYVANQASRIAEGPDARMEAKLNSGALPQGALDQHWAEKSKKPWGLGRPFAAPRNALFSTMGAERNGFGAGRTCPSAVHRARAGDAHRARGGAAGRPRLAENSTRENCSDTRDDRAGTRGNRPETRGGHQGGRGKEHTAREGAKVRPGRPSNIFDSISDTHPMPEEDVRACQLAFDMTADEFSEARRRAQQVRQQAMGRRDQEPDTSMERSQSRQRAGVHAYAQAPVGESSLELDSSQITASSFELQDTRDYDNDPESSPAQPPHDNWIQHEQSSIGLSGLTSSRTHLSELDGYFADADVSQILPVIEPPRYPSPLSPDANIHRLTALHTLQRNDVAVNKNAPTDPYHLNITPTALLRAPTRHRVGIARTTREPFHPPPSPSASRSTTRPSPPLPFPALQSRRGVSRLPSTRRVRSQRNITPLLLAQRASQAVGMSLRGRGRGFGLGHGRDEGIELREFGSGGGGGGGFFALGDDGDVEAQRTEEQNRNHWWRSVVLV